MGSSNSDYYCSIINSSTKIIKQRSLAKLQGFFCKVLAKNAEKHYNKIEESVKNERIFYETSFKRSRKSI